MSQDVTHDQEGMEAARQRYWEVFQKAWPVTQSQGTRRETWDISWAAAIAVFELLRDEGRLHDH